MERENEFDVIGQAVADEVGLICSHCDEPIASGDWVQRGMNFIMHAECGCRMIVGSVAHQMKQCTCYGGAWEDDPDLSKRENARLAFECNKRMHGLL